jgi:hypothetical protein
MLKTGTTTGHYMRFVVETLDIIDRREDVEGFYLIMGNVPIHTSKKIEAMIKE